VDVLLQGVILTQDGLQYGSVDLQSWRLQLEDVERVDYLIMPLLPDAHVHTGDHDLGDQVLPGKLEDVVGPGGLKERFLRTGDVQESIAHALRRMERMGVGWISDFREGGLQGVEVLRKAASGSHLNVQILGRPMERRYWGEELDRILELADGVAISALRDWNWDDALAVSTHVREMGKTFAMHASEGVREDLNRILELDPDFLVHMSCGTTDDFRELAEVGIPVVVCPTSNMFFGIRPKLREMLDAGVTCALGSDNAFLRSSIYREMEYTSRVASEEEVIKLLENGWKLLNPNQRILLSEGDVENLVAVEIPRRGENVFSNDLHSARKIVAVSGKVLT